MTRSIAHRELRNNSGEVLRSVQQGETFEVTNHGEVVAILAPPQSGPLAGLRYSPATKRGGFLDLPKVAPAEPTAVVLDDLRDEG